MANLEETKGNKRSKQAMPRPVITTRTRTIEYNIRSSGDDGEAIEMTWTNPSFIVRMYIKWWLLPKFKRQIKRRLSQPIAPDVATKQSVHKKANRGGKQ